MGQAAEVVVIGSGFGGSVVAARLAEAGVRVTLLERGPWRDTVPTRSMGIENRAPFPRKARMVTGLLRNVGGSRPTSWGVRLSKTGLYEMFFGNGISVICSSNVGGGSQIYSAVHCKPAMPDFWDGHAEGVSTAGMEPHYQSVLARFGSVVPTPALRLPNTTYQRYAGSNVLEPAQPYADARLGYLLPEDPDNPRSIVDTNGIERREVDYKANDEGFLGSPGGGKTTLDVAYLWPAMQRGLTVRDLCEVLEIRRIASTSPRYRVLFRNLHIGRRESLLTDNVVVAAGALNTLRLLLHSRDAGALSGMSQLGRRFGTNGDVFGYWDYKSPEDLSAGLPTRGGFRPRGETNSPVLGGGAFPSIDHYPLPKKTREKLKHSLFVAGMGPDAMDGAVTQRDGRFGVSFRAENSPIFREVWATMDKVADLTGRSIRYPRTPSTVHPMGGACLGQTEETGLIDANGEVFGHPGLFVADSAAFPRSPGAPPTLSIAAWADHVASRFLERNGKSTAPLPG